MIHIRMAWVALLMVSGIAAAAGGSAAEQTPEQRAARIAPLVGNQTIAVAHLDLARADVERAATLLQSVVGSDLAADHLQILRSVVKPGVNQLVSAGAQDVFVVIGLEDLPKPRIVLALAAEPEKRRAIRDLLKSTFHQESQESADLIVIGTTGAGAVPAASANRPELQKAFEAAGDTDGQLLIIPSQDIRRSISETTRLPELLGGASGRTFAEGAQWTAIGITLKPEFQITLTAQSKDAAAAEALKRVLADVVIRLQQTNAFSGDHSLLAHAANQFQVTGDRLSWNIREKGAEGGSLELFKRPVRRIITAANRAQSTNRLKQLLLAMHNYHDTYRHLPAPAVRDSEGKALLSWRVLLLPFLDQNELYKQFRLDEPWDSEHNKKLIERMPDVFASVPSAGPGKTRYVVTTGPHGFYQEARGVKLNEVLDGSSNTLLIVELLSPHAVIWTKPDDLEVSPEEPFDKLVDEDSEGFLAARADGSVGFFSRDLSKEVLLALFGLNDGKPIQ